MDIVEAGACQDTDLACVRDDAAAANNAGGSDDVYKAGLAAHRRGDHERAVASFNRAIAADPANADCRWHRAVACVALGRLNEAAADYREAVRLRPDSAAFHNDLGVVLARQGRHEEAAGHYREAIRLKPDFPDPHNNLGNAVRHAGKLDEAIASYQEALRLRPAYPEAHNNLGIALRQKGKRAEAIASYHEALRLRPAYPEAHNNLGLALNASGRSEAAVPCYQQAIRLKPDYAEAMLNLASALNDLERYGEAEAALREAIRIRPDARAHKILGLTLARQNRLDEAIASYREALRLRPNYSDAHNDLGIALARQNRFEDAVASYRQALVDRPKYAEAHNNMGNALRNLGRFDEAIAAYDRAVELRPGYADAYNNRGIALAEQGQYDQAVASYSRCIQLRPNHHDAHLNRSLTWLRQGRFAQGWPEYEWRHRKKPPSPRPMTQPGWNGFSPAGLRMLLIGEQGMGDIFQFIRYAPLLHRLGATVIFECPAKLLKILESVSGIDQLYAQGQEPPEHDVHCPLMTLPGLLGTSFESVPARVPYIQADPGLVEHWQRELVGYPEFKVGINWQGNPKFSGDFHRSIPLRHFEPLAGVPGVRLFSLQKCDGLDQLEAIKDALPVVDLGCRLDDANGSFMDSAAVLKNLDLLITSDTAIAHLAGALGVPVWVALPFSPAWQWLFRAGREDTPWYPTMRLFRPAKPGGWPALFERIGAELARMVPPAPRARSIGVEISPGELIERIATLELEAEEADDETARGVARADLVPLAAARDATLPALPELSALAAAMRASLRAQRRAEAVLRDGRTGGGGPGAGLVEAARALAVERGSLVELRRKIDALSLKKGGLCAAAGRVPPRGG